jgi:hypothetical protein
MKIQENLRMHNKEIKLDAGGASSKKGGAGMKRKRLGHRHMLGALGLGLS